MALCSIAYAKRIAFNETKQRKKWNIISGHGHIFAYTIQTATTNASCSLSVFNTALTTETPFIRQISPEVIVKNSCLKDFSNFTGKNVQWNLQFLKITDSVLVKLQPTKRFHRRYFHLSFVICFPNNYPIEHNLNGCFWIFFWILAQYRC